MMNWPLVVLLYFLVVVFYSAYAYIGYLEDLKNNTTLYFVVGLAIALAGNVFWLILTKVLPSKSNIYIGGIIYDTLITICFIVVPMLFFSIKMSGYQWLGIGLIIIGLGAIKLGG